MFTSTIQSKEKDPLGCMLLDYWAGRIDASIEVESSTLEMWKMTGARMFRSFEQMSEIERIALDHCRGMVVDVGAGSGCHSLALQERGVSVRAIDISPGCVEVMHRRGLADAACENLFGPETRRCDTLLMLMNGVGICGSLEGCNLFFQVARNMLADSGQILADSTDLAVFTGGEEFFEDGGYIGETEFIMKYGNVVSDPFGWLYISYPRLEKMANDNGFICEKIGEDKEGGYLARIRKKRRRALY